MTQQEQDDKRIRLQQKAGSTWKKNLVSSNFHLKLYKFPLKQYFYYFLKEKINI